MARITGPQPGRALVAALAGALCLALGLSLGTTPAAARASSAPSAASVPATIPATLQPGPLAVVPSRILVQRLLEQRVLELTNQRRRAHGCTPLRHSVPLRRAARGHTVEMALAGVMSHQLPGEPKFSTRITRAGYTGWRLVAENVARGFSGPAAVVRAWMNSPGHRRNILNCRLRDLGVGVVLQDGQLWWTQDFGRR